MTPEPAPKQTALLSVYDKTGLIPFALELIDLGFDLLASGGTAKALRDNSVPVTDVATMVGDPILGHKVVTLSREVHAGLLADGDEELAELERLNIKRIDLVCVDLYPLKEEVEKPEADRESVIAKTDVGGPTMLHAGAKGRRIVISSVDDRQPVIEWLRAGRPDEDTFITGLVVKAEDTAADHIKTSADFHRKSLPVAT